MDSSRRQFAWLVVSAALLPTLVRAQGKKPAYPDSVDGLKRLMTDLYAAIKAGDRARSSMMIGSLALPAHESWFRTTFGDAAGARVATEYGNVLPRFESELGGLFEKIVREGQSDIQVRRFDRAGSPDAVGLQNDAMATMKVLRPIYSVRFVRPGERLGQHLYSFVFVDGAFRLAGKMQAALPAR